MKESDKQKYIFPPTDDEDEEEPLCGHPEKHNNAEPDNCSECQAIKNNL